MDLAKRAVKTLGRPLTVEEDAVMWTRLVAGKEDAAKALRHDALTPALGEMAKAEVDSKTFAEILKYERDL